MKNHSLTTKKLLIVALAVILLVTCFSSSTYSWFTTSTSSNTRPNSSSGKSLSLTLPAQEAGANAALTAYDGSGVTMNTYLSTDDGVTFSETPAAPATSGSLGTTSPSNRIYYKTEIINGKTTPQNVSLYIKNFAPTSTSGANVCVGTNEPVKSFKNYSMTGVTIPAPTKTQWNTTTKRVYFCPTARVKSGNAYDAHRSAWGGTDFWVKSGNDINNSVTTSTQMTRCSSSSDYYYADIPWNENQLYFSRVDNVTQGYERTQSFTDLYSDGLSTTQSLMFYTNGDYNDYNNAWAGKETCTGANVATFYNNVTISNVSGQEVYVNLESGWYSSQATISYSSSNTGVFTINSSGKIVPVAAGTAYIQYTVTSQYGESRVFGSSSLTKVTVNTVNTNTSTIKAAPIVTNLLIPAATTANTVNSDQSNVQVVYWFIQNGDPLYGAATATGTYTLSGIYLGL